ncbi:ribosome silencing factor [Candidatus Viadribacter manganicus]|uniref:ribosome silencing factor n=1 Tax=Candidatus Viadribacter manganicus TaxID=1759059 RepID=UPI0009F2F560|nr:ribosome silencing factor [Candidatus Viadribacter manganicus]
MKRTPAAKAGATPRAANRPAPGIDVEAATKVVLTSLEDDKAEEILAIDIRGKSSFADMLVIASGRSARHVGALADHVMRQLKDAGVKDVRIEGMPQADWVLVDAGDVVIHLFRPEVRAFYNIEKIWSGATPDSVQS